jgi:hypothetical protein
MGNMFNFDEMDNEGQHFVDMDVAYVCDILGKTRAMPIMLKSLANFTCTKVDEWLSCTHVQSIVEVQIVASHL